MGTEMDTLVVGNCLMRKPAQDQSLSEDYKDKFDLD
jgi:carbamoyltransferase